MFRLRSATTDASAGLQFRLLGPVEIRSGGGVLGIGPPKQRTVLAVLLSMPNAMVSAEQFVDELWGASPPPSAVANIRGYVAGLRRALPEDQRHRLTTRSHGYQLAAQREEVDTAIFETLAAQGRAALARDDPAAAAHLLERAIGLWRGLPLEDVVRGSRLDAVAARLDEGRLTVQEDLFAARLALGEDGRLVPALRQWIAAHPLREKGWEHLVLALYRAGDPSAALATYQEARATLAEELGIDPSRELRDLQRAILHRDDAVLAVRRAPVVVLMPRELPAAPFGFVGRVREVGLIRDLLHGTRCAGLPRTVAVHGPAGVGKSALACVAAHAVAGEYPDGQLYVDLAGAADPARVLARLLRSLQPHGGPAAGDVREASARYRSLVAEKRILVVLDNAGSDEQIEPLLPAGGGCGVIVTSRAVLRGIDDSRRLILRPLPEESGRELLSRCAGAQRLAAEPDAARDLVLRCGGLPQALRLAASQLVHGSRG